MARSAQQIADALECNGFGELEALIDCLRDIAREPRNRNSPEGRLAVFMLSDLVDAKIAAEAFIATLASQEAQAERIAEEADRQMAECA